MGGEGLELLGVGLSFPAVQDGDPLLERFGDAAMISEMRKVFFDGGANTLGHSYANLLRGPGGRSDFEDVIALLRSEPWSKRAVVMLCGLPNGKVPCLNAVQFLLRDKLQTIYFARGQDAFRKFYADALCVREMARKVAAGLRVAAGTITGFIGSCHVYHHDRPAIDRLIEQARPYMPQPDAKIAQPCRQESEIPQFAPWGNRAS
jgi:thymidylate synthase